MTAKLPVFLRRYRYPIIAFMAGLASFVIAYFLESVLGSGLTPIYYFAFAIAIEEALRMAICLFFFSSAKSDKREELALWAVVASGFFGIAENILYYIMSPDTMAFVRILYSQPVHVVCALCYVLCLNARRQMRALIAAVAAAIVYHASFNAASALLPLSVAIPAGITVNIISLVALDIMVRERILFKGAFNGQR